MKHALMLGACMLGVIVIGYAYTNTSDTLTRIACTEDKFYKAQGITPVDSISDMSGIKLYQRTRCKK